MDNQLTFGAEALASILVLTGKATPTPAELTTAIAELYGDGAGPSIPDLLAGGWLVPSVDKQRLRLPPIAPAEMQRRYQGRSLVASSNLRPGGASGSNDGPGVAPETRRFSYFKGPIRNIFPRTAITVADLYKVITTPPKYLRERTNAVRAEYEAHGKSNRYRELKTQLDYFTAGGTFTQRQDAALVVPSGLLILDFDEMQGGVSEARTALLADPTLAPAMALMFVSPSGDGLKVVVATDPKSDRGKNYKALTRYLTDNYGWGPTLDSKTADVSRACFLSHDPDAWVAPVYRATEPTQNPFHNTCALEHAKS